MESLIRLCLECGRALRGRTDKKYCSDVCRNSHNNKMKEPPDPAVKRINGILSHNRKLLSALIKPGEELAKCARAQLQRSGFDFHYYTHQYVNRKGNVYHFCYDLGYLPIEAEWVLVVRRKEW